MRLGGENRGGDDFRLLPKGLGRKMKMMKMMVKMMEMVTMMEGVMGVVEGGDSGSEATRGGGGE